MTRGILGPLVTPLSRSRHPSLPHPKLFSLKLFGGASIEGPAGALTGRAAQRHRLALLALLASSGTGGVTRDKLTAYLWPEADEERGRHLLSNSLYMLRQALGEDAVIGAGDVVRLDAARVRCDVRDFEDALGRGELARAVGLYTGPFLDGFFLTDAPEFEHWATRERERLAAAYARALESLAEGAERERDYSESRTARSRGSTAPIGAGRIAATATIRRSTRCAPTPASPACPSASTGRWACGRTRRVASRDPDGTSFRAERP